MNNIASSVYENLTPRQRVIASIEAEARCDEEEKRRLIKTCPKKAYLQTDLEFSEGMEKLLGLAMAVEADLRGCVLFHFAALRVDAKNSSKFLQDFADIQAAWKSTISQMGIDPDAMKKAGPPASPVFDLIEDVIPKSNNKKTDLLVADMLDILGSAKF